jgi:hypothetical protein
VGWEGEVDHLFHEELPFYDNVEDPEVYLCISYLELKYKTPNRVAFADLPTEFKDGRIKYSQPLALHFDAFIAQPSIVKWQKHGVKINRATTQLWVSSGPRDASSLKELIDNRRYLFVFVRETQITIDFLLLKDHLDYCSRVGVARISHAGYWSPSSCLTYARHIQLR